MNCLHLHHKLVLGLHGIKLTASECYWLQHYPPRGIILFARNIATPKQLQHLIDDCHALAGKDLWIAIDEEGGRVFRIPWQPFSVRPSAASYAKQYANNAAAACQAVQNEAASIGKQLKDLGITHNCAPVLDVRHPSGHTVIGNRAYGNSIDIVTKLSIACLHGYLQAGIIPVGKHYPGHGRANADSHYKLPYVAVADDILTAEQAPFFAAIDAGLRHIMMAHVCYGNDVLPASLSASWLARLHTYNADLSLCVWSDDLCMAAVAHSSDTVWQAVLQAHAVKNDILLVCQAKGVADVMQFIRKS